MLPAVAGSVWVHAWACVLRPVRTLNECTYLGGALKGSSLLQLDLHGQGPSSQAAAPANGQSRSGASVPAGSGAGTSTSPRIGAGAGARAAQNGQNGGGGGSSAGLPPSALRAAGLQPLLSPTLYVKYGGVANGPVRAAFREGGLRPTRKGRRWLVQWGGILDGPAFAKLHAFQRVNHFPGTWELGHKGHLYRNVYAARRRCRSGPAAEAFDIVPRFYIMPRDYDEFRQDTERFPDRLYIQKPTNSSRGRGIRMVTRPESISRDTKDTLIQVWGFDIMLTDTFRAWLIEANTCPRSLSPAELPDIVLEAEAEMARRGSWQRVFPCQEDPTRPPPPQYGVQSSACGLGGLVGSCGLCGPGRGGEGKREAALFHCSPGREDVWRLSGHWSACPEVAAGVCKRLASLRPVCPGPLPLAALGTGGNGVAVAGAAGGKPQAGICWALSGVCSPEEHSTGSMCVHAGQLQPDAVALDVQAPYIKSFTRMAKALPPGLMDKLTSAPLTSLSAALNHGDDFDRSGGSPIDLDEATLVNVFANSALDEDEFWSDADTAGYHKRLMAAAEPQLRAAVNTWLQGIPSGTTATLPRQRFVLTRLEAALTPDQQRAFQAADVEWRRGHKEPRVREQQALREQQAAHMAARIADVAAGRIGGRRCSRVLAVLGGGHAARVRALLQAQQAR
eukprot:XP_001697600.1 predicted protein [Chlamydomonas reinhardtii]